MEEEKTALEQGQHFLTLQPQRLPGASTELEDEQFVAQYIFY